MEDRTNFIEGYFDLKNECNLLISRMEELARNRYVTPEMKVEAMNEILQIGTGISRIIDDDFKHDIFTESIKVREYFETMEEFMNAIYALEKILLH